MDGAPEVGIQLEVADAQLMAQMMEQPAQVGLYFRMGTIEHIPGGTTPTAIGDPLGRQRRAGLILYEPVRMVAQDL